MSLKLFLLNYIRVILAPQMVQFNVTRGGVFNGRPNTYFDVRYNKTIVTHCVKIGTKIKKTIKIMMPEIVKIEMIEILKTVEASRYPSCRAEFNYLTLFQQYNLHFVFTFVIKCLDFIAEKKKVMFSTCGNTF